MLGTQEKAPAEAGLSHVAPKWRQRGRFTKGNAPRRAHRVRRLTASRLRVRFRFFDGVFRKQKAPHEASSTGVGRRRRAYGRARPGASGERIPVNTEQSRPWRRPGNPGQSQGVTTLVADVDVSQPGGGDLPPDNLIGRRQSPCGRKERAGSCAPLVEPCAVQLFSPEKLKRWPYGLVLLGRKLNRGLNLLDYRRPVTLEAAGSSPVAPAIKSNI
jgi:hypothetical protein